MRVQLGVDMKPKNWYVIVADVEGQGWVLAINLLFPKDKAEQMLRQLENADSVKEVRVVSVVDVGDLVERGPKWLN